MGNPKTVLENPNSIVISESIAKKYFNDENPIGETLTVGYDYSIDFTVSGVMKEIPHNSQIQFNMLVPFKLLKSNISWTIGTILYIFC